MHNCGRDAGGRGGALALRSGRRPRRLRHILFVKTVLKHYFVTVRDAFCVLNVKLLNTVNSQFVGDSSCVE